MEKEEQLSRQLKSLNFEEKALVIDILDNLPKEKQQFLLETGSQLIKSSTVNGTWYWRQFPELAQRLTWRELEIWLRDCVQVSRGNWECALAMLKNSTETRELSGPEMFLQGAQLGRMLMHYCVAEALWYFKNSAKLVERIGIKDWSLLLNWGTRMLAHSWQGTVSCFRCWSEIEGTLTENRKQEVLAQGFKVSQLFSEAAQSYFQALPRLVKAYGGNQVETWVNCAESLEKGKKGLIDAYFLATPGLVGKVDQQIFSSRISQWVAWGNRLASWSTCLAETFFAGSAQLLKNIEWTEIEKIVQLAEDISENCFSELCAVEFIKRASEISNQLDVCELAQWVRHGLKKSTTEKKQAYFLMKSQESREAIALFRRGLTLEAVQKVVSLYCEGLTGKQVVIRKASELPETLHKNNRLFSTLDTRRIYLPDIVKLFEDNQNNLRFYRVLLLHQVAHQEFGTLDLSPEELRELSETPLLGLIFRLLEDNRVDYLAMQNYTGFSKDRNILRESCQKTLKTLKPLSQCASPKQSPYPELLYLRDYLWLGDDPLGKRLNPKNEFNRELQKKVADFWDQVKGNGASAGAALRVARQVQGLLENNLSNQLTPDSLEDDPLYALPQRGSLDYDLLYISRSIDDEENSETKFDINSDFQLGLRKLLVQFLEDENNPYRLVAYYDEWDRILNDYKKDWCRVREILLKPSTGRFVQQTLDENYGMINTLKRYFGMLRPDRFRRYPRQEEGDDLDLDAVIEGMVENRAGVSPRGGFYVRRDKRERDVAVGFLLDLSFSTEEVIKNKGKTLLDVEQESVIVMAEALEVLGDNYAIYGFNSDGRDKVTFYVVKDFEETYNWDIKQRFGGLKSHGMTRLAAAVRHATFKMEEVKAAVKILVVLSDGRPFDFDYHSGLSKDYEEFYAETDTKMALREARMRGINPFCITVDNRGQDYMHHIFGQVNYIIINEVEALPTKLTETYKNLTT